MFGGVAQRGTSGKHLLTIGLREDSVVIPKDLVAHSVLDSALLLVRRIC